MAKIKTEELKKIAKEVILKTGNVSDEDADKVIDILMYAEMTGRNTQGMIKLTGTEPLQTIEPKGEVLTLKETPVSAHMDANGNPSPIATDMATDKAIEKCKESGVGVVGIKDIYTSNGAQAYYVKKIAEAGYVGVVCSRSPGVVAPHGGKEPLFGTNPIGFGFPTLGEPILFDMATSAITWYGLVKAKAEGAEIPGDVAMDKDGNLTTDPGEAMDGAALPFDRSYKGAGLSMMVELLGGPLVGASFCNIDAREKDWGTFILAIDPELFGDREQFKKSSTQMLEIIRGSKTREEGGTVSIPGDRSVENYKRAVKTGEVEISDALLNDLRAQLS